MILLQRLRLVCTPSLLSGTIVFALVVLTLGVNAWIYIDDSRLFYDDLFGARGIITAVLQTPADVVSLLRTAFVGNVTYYALLALFSAFVGLAVYEVLIAMDRIRSNVKEMQLEVRVAGLSYRQALEERVEILGIRFFVCCAWALYGLLFIKLLLPFGIILLQNGIDAIEVNVANGWLSLVASAGFLALIWHIHVIFMRLVALRLRVLSENVA